MAGNVPPGWNSKPPKVVPKSVLGTPKGAVSLSPEKYEALIKQQGVRVRVWRSATCPNVKDISSAQHEIDCKICNGGHGFVDVLPIETIAVIQNQALEKLQNVEGVLDGNTVAATFQLGVELQYFTLVELCDFTDIFYQLVKRQRGAIDVLNYKACRVNFVMDSSGKMYQQDSDFILDENGCIKWNAGKGPTPETIYTIHFEVAQQFRAIRAIHVNRFTQDGRKSDSVKFIKMPEQWVLQRSYLVDRKDRTGNELSSNLIRNKDNAE